MDFPNATEPLDITAVEIPADIADLYVTTIREMDQWCAQRGICGFLAAGLADMVASGMAAAHASGHDAAREFD